MEGRLDVGKYRRGKLILEVALRVSGEDHFTRCRFFTFHIRHIGEVRPTVLRCVLEHGLPLDHIRVVQYLADNTHPNETQYFVDRFQGGVSTPQGRLRMKFRRVPGLKQLGADDD